MPAVNFLTREDRQKAKKNLWPIVSDMDERELRIALLYIIYGVDIYEAIDSAMIIKKPD